MYIPLLKIYVIPDKLFQYYHEAMFIVDDGLLSKHYIYDVY